MLGNHTASTPKTQRIVIWSRCKICQRIVTPLVAMSDSMFDMSFGKYLELTFYQHPAICRTGKCKHKVMTDHIRCFGFENFVVEFDYQYSKPYQVYTSRNINFEWHLMYDYIKQEINIIDIIAKYTFAAFLQKAQILKEAIGACVSTDDTKIAIEELTDIEKETSERLKVGILFFFYFCVFLRVFCVLFFVYFVGFCFFYNLCYFLCVLVVLPTPLYFFFFCVWFF